jgi:hypothetical protein
MAERNVVRNEVPLMCRVFFIFQTLSTGAKVRKWVNFFFLPSSCVVFLQQLSGEVEQKLPFIKRIFELVSCLFQYYTNATMLHP